MGVKQAEEGFVGNEQGRVKLTFVPSARYRQLTLHEAFVTGSMRETLLYARGFCTETASFAQVFLVGLSMQHSTG